MSARHAVDPRFPPITTPEKNADAGAVFLPALASQSRCSTSPQFLPLPPIPPQTPSAESPAATAPPAANSPLPPPPTPPPRSTASPPPPRSAVARLTGEEER